VVEARRVDRIWVVMLMTHLQFESLKGPCAESLRIRWNSISLANAQDRMQVELEAKTGWKSSRD
jgi:hypothetical protein